MNNKNTSSTYSNIGLLENMSILFIGYEAVSGNPYPLKIKILDSLLKTNNQREIIQSIIKTWIEIHGIYYQFSSKQQKTCKVTTKSLFKLQDIISSNYKNQKNIKLDNELKLLIIRNSTHNQIFQYLAKFQLVRIPQPVSYIKSLKRKYSICSSHFSPSHIANVLCWVTSNLLKNICPHEFANCAWTKATKHKCAPNICRAIRFYNFLSQKIATEIVLTRDTTSRTNNIQRAIEIAFYAKQNNNFEVISAIIAGLNSCSASPDRLKKSWSLVSHKLFNVFTELESLVAPLSNYGIYRSTTNEILNSSISSLAQQSNNQNNQNNIIFVPALSVILRDIVACYSSDSTNISSFLQNLSSHSNSNNFPSDYINKIGKIIWPIVNMQLSTYMLKDFQQNYNEYDEFLNKLLSNSPGSENLLMRLSYKREPPKNLQLLCDDDQFSPVSDQSSSASSIIQHSITKKGSYITYHEDELHPPSDDDAYLDSNSDFNDELMPILNNDNTDNLTTFFNTLTKDPATWNQLEVQIVLESWGLPPDLCIRLSRRYIKNGISLLKFVPTEELITEEKYRSLINLKLEELLRQRISGCNIEDNKTNLRSQSHISAWNCNQVCQWLNNTNYSKYSPLFDDQSITGNELMKMTNYDLGELGVSKPKDRKGILKLVNKLANPQTKKKWGLKMSLGN